MTTALGVRFNATSTGTGDFVDLSVVTGYRRGAANLVDGLSYRYRAENASLSEYEWGSGVWNSSTSTLARTTIAFSSTGSKISFTSAPQVAIIIFPEDVRDVLLADRTYYVRTDGFNTNNGLTNGPFGAFLTIQKALDVVAALDCSTFVVTISVQAATWTTPVVLPKILGTATPVFTGVGSTTILSMSTGDCITNDGGGLWQINSLKLVNTTGPGAQGIVTKNGGAVKFQAVEFGAISGYGIFCNAFSSVTCTGNYSISGGGQYHIISNGVYTQAGLATTVTLSGTPAFSGAFVLSSRTGSITALGVTYSGAATGTRYSAVSNSVIDTAGGGANYFPGSVAGSTATGGQYL